MLMWVQGVAFTIMHKKSGFGRQFVTGNGFVVVRAQKAKARRKTFMHWADDTFRYPSTPSTRLSGLLMPSKSMFSAGFRHCLWPARGIYELGGAWGIWLQNHCRAIVSAPSTPCDSAWVGSDSGLET